MTALVQAVLLFLLVGGAMECVNFTSRDSDTALQMVRARLGLAALAFGLIGLAISIGLQLGAQ